MGEGTALLRLQQVDLELARCERDLGSLPQRDRLTQIKTALKKLGREQTQLVALRKDVEMEIADNRADREATGRLVDEAQAGAIADGSDYRAVKDLETRLTDLAKRLEKLDYDHAGLEGQLADLLERERRTAGVRGQLEAQERLQLESFKASAHDILVRRKELSEERAELVGQMSPALLARYGRALDRFGGQAVESLEGNRPTSCRVSLQPSSISSLRLQSGITECPYCKRILVLDEGDE